MRMVSQERDLVWRITVDEQLDTERVRLLIAAYVGTSKTSFLDPIEDWSDEVERTIRPEQLPGFFGEGEEAPTWGELREGQVYLVGSVEPSCEEDHPVSFRSARTAPTPHRLDSIPSLKKEQKRLYSDLLGHRGGRHASP